MAKTLNSEGRALYVGMVELEVPSFVVRLSLSRTCCGEGGKNERVHKLEAAVT